MKTHDARYQEFLRRLREAREKAGLSQSEAARRLGKTQAYIWKSEVGERRIDFVEALIFARLYGKSAQYFCRGLLDFEEG
jgi:transcriptional regulator with XRE-family HTH domain